MMTITAYISLKDSLMQLPNVNSINQLDRLRSFIQYDYSIGLRDLVGSRTASPPALYQIE